MEGDVGYSCRAELHRCLDSAMLRLISIWDQIGIEAEPRRSRETTVHQLLSGLLEEMVTEEDQLRKRLLENIQKFSLELFSLTEELSLPSYEPEDNCSVLQLDKKLRAKIGELRSEKHNRLERLRHLTTEDERLARDLSLSPYHVASPKPVPTVQYLKALEEHVAELGKEQERRWKLLCDIRKEIETMLEELDLQPESKFDKDVLKNPEIVTLTMANIDRARDYQEQLAILLAGNKERVKSLWAKIRALWSRLEIPKEETEPFEKQITNYSNHTIRQLKDELQKCEQLKLVNIQKIIERLRDELTTWWDKCYVLPEHRLIFTSFSEEPPSEELLLRHELELQTVKTYYEDHKEILDKVARRQQLWFNFLEMERKATNPDRFLNRGGNLLKEEKARKKLALELPKIEQEVAAQVDAWENSSGREFLISGMTFRDYVRRDHDNFAMEKENEKICRQQQKAKQIEEELMYGSRPVTPGTKRFASNTTRNTPNKLRKVGTVGQLGSLSKASASIYGSHRNLTNLCSSPLRTPSREMLCGSVPKGLNTIGLDLKLQHNGPSKGKGCPPGPGGVSGCGDTMSSAKSLFHGRTPSDKNLDAGSAIKQAKTRTEPYF